MAEFNESTKKALAQDFVRYVHEDLLQVKHPHFDIAFRLHEAKLNGYYALLGYDNIYDLAEVEFGFKRSSTKAYVAVCEQYMSGLGNRNLTSIWAEYSFSQLVEMLSLQPWQRRQIKPSMTIKDIRAWKQNHKTVKLSDGRLRLYGDLSPAERAEYEASLLTPKSKLDAGQTSGQQQAVKKEVKPEVVTTEIEVPKSPLLCLKNKADREKWLDSYESWGVWLNVPQLDLKVYRFQFANGDELMVSHSYFYNSMTYNKDKRCVLRRYHLKTEEIPFFDLSGVSKTYVLDYMTEKAKEI